MRLLTIKWPKLPCTKKIWDGNPLGYLSHIFGHEGENSLLSELVKQDLAINLSSCPGTRLQSAFSEFKLDITLTEKGMRQYEDVIRLVFAMINKIKQEGPQDHTLREMQIMSDLRF